MWEKIKDFIVTVEENDTVKKMTFEEASNLDTNDTYNFLVFTFPEDPENFFSTGFRKDCIDSWKAAFPKMRIIKVNVRDCIHLNKWVSESYHAKSYPNDCLRPLFLGYLNNGIYCDADVFLIKNAKKELPLTSYECFVGQYSCSGTFLFNKNKGNPEMEKWFHLYDKFETFDRVFTDCMTYLDGRDRGELNVPEFDTCGIANHLAGVFLNIRDKIPFTMAFNMQEDKKCSAVFSKECYDTMLKYLNEKAVNNPEYKTLLQDDAKEYFLFV